MKHLKSFGQWFNKQEITLLKVLLLVYIYFIPLWPKLPFWNVNYTYIAVRYEDLFVALIALVFVFDLVRGKVRLKKDVYLWLIPLFWLSLILSTFVGFYLGKTIITLQLGLLHSFRRIEYMIVFFIAFSLIKNVQQLKFYLNQLVTVVFLVSIYGLGQKFLGWPAVQTMNPHYSKGYLLVLDANSRISSTFGGHYDLAAFLVFFIPFVLGMFFIFKKLRYFIVFVLALSALIFTASRVSYGAYIVTVPVYLLSQRQFKFFLVVLLLTAALTYSSSSLTSRINRTFRSELVWVSAKTGETIVPRDNTSVDLPVGDYVIKNEGNTDLKVEPAKVILIKREIKENLVKNAQKSGTEISEAELNRQVEIAFSQLKPVSSVLPDISFATRLQVEWPRAVKALLKNPLLGTGPSSITEATDNDFLRSLGESGLMGFSLLMFIVGTLNWYLLRMGLKFKELQPLFWGLMFGGGALLINALYIDVFEASKVALMIWLTWGMFYKLKYLNPSHLI